MASISKNPQPQPAEEAAGLNSGGPAFSPLLIVVITGVLACFLLVSLYAIFSKYWCSGVLEAGPPAGDDTMVGTLASESMDKFRMDQLPSCRYQRDAASVASTECAVCLAEFRDGENLRRLPDCRHGFHLACIKSWLRSHSSCPVCRAEVVLKTGADKDLEEGEGETRLSGNRDPV